MNVPGLSGSWQERLNQFGQRFYGNSYQGNTQQNLDLINKINAGNYGAPQPAAPAQTGTSVSDYIKSITGGTRANAATQFEKILPYQQYMGALDAKGAATKEVAPQADAYARGTLNNFDTQKAATGSNRFGSYFADRGNLAGELINQRNQKIGDIQGTYEDQFTKQYQQLVDQYYKDPNIDVYKLAPGVMNNVPATTEPAPVQSASYFLPFSY